MELVIMDDNFVEVKTVDNYDNCLWVDKYNTFGTVSITASMDSGLFENAIAGRYIATDLSTSIMIIQDREVGTERETVASSTITGVSLESILGRRIIWFQTILSGNFQNGIKKIINENAITPVDPTRVIPRLRFIDSTDPYITALTINAQFTGDNLLESIVSLCTEKQIGFKITLSEDYKLDFMLYKGKDRSYSQVVLAPVVFSPNFDNLKSSRYIETTSNLKNAALIAGEGEGADRRTTTIGTATGLNRYELYVDARDISSVRDDITIPPAEYIAQLQQRGNEALAEYQQVQAFEGEVEPSGLYIFGRDFFLGDTIQIENEYKLEAKSLVSEIIISQDENGLTMVPTFVTVI